jgi:CTP:molybdopterin cytidylyltransferase MocA
MKESAPPAPGAEIAAIVLAGSRSDRDPVAEAAHVTHKALAPVAGRAMLSRVIDALQALPAVCQIVVVAPSSREFEALPGMAEALADGRLLRLDPASGPAGSVAAALEKLDTERPVLVTTADHPLLSVAMLEQFLQAAPRDAVACVAVAEETLVREAHPDAVRTFYRFAGEAVSGCNLFLLRGREARKAVAFWQSIEGARKRPWRIVGAVGPGALAAFCLGRLSLDAALHRLSRHIGVPVTCVRLPFAEAAIDVDRPEDLELVERILSQRR